MSNNTTMLKPAHSTLDTPAACSEAYLLTKQNSNTHFHRNLPVAGSTAAPRRLQLRGLHSPPSPRSSSPTASHTPRSRWLAPDHLWATSQIARTHRHQCAPIPPHALAASLAAGRRGGVAGGGGWGSTSRAPLCPTSCHHRRSHSTKP